MPPRPGFWWVYVLERADGSWYTGISTDPRRRLEQHKRGRGAKANKVSEPQRLVCLEPAGPYPSALRREAQVKGLSKAAKRLYAQDPGSLEAPAPRQDVVAREQPLSSGRVPSLAGVQQKLGKRKEVLGTTKKGSRGTKRRIMKK